MSVTASATSWNAVSLLGGDVEAYPCFRFPNARVKTPNLRIGRRRRSDVVPSLKAPSWACVKMAGRCAAWRFSSWCVRPSGLHLAGGLSFGRWSSSGVHISRSSNSWSLATRFTCSCALVGAVLPTDGAAFSIQDEKVWTFFGGRVDRHDESRSSPLRWCIVRRFPLLGLYHSDG